MEEASQGGGLGWMCNRWELKPQVRGRKVSILCHPAAHKHYVVR